MNKKRKQIGRKKIRRFDREIFNYRPIPESVIIKKSLQRAFPCKFCQKSYLDSMIAEFDRLIAQDEMKVAIVDNSGRDMSQLYNLMAMMQGNEHGFNS